MEGAHCDKVFVDELNTIVSKDVHWNAGRDKPMIEKDFFNVCGCCFEDWDSSGQLGILVGNNKHVLVTLCFYEKGFRYIHCEKIRVV